MKNILKKFDRIGLMVLLATIFIAVGFKAAEKVETEAWYNVEITPGKDHSLPQFQEIREKLDNDPTGLCNTNPGIICAIELDLPPGTPAPATVSDAESMSVTTGNSRQRQ